MNFLRRNIVPVAAVAGSVQDAYEAALAESLRNLDVFAQQQGLTAGLYAEAKAEIEARLGRWLAAQKGST